jgi:hypothetical protein
LSSFIRQGTNEKVKRDFTFTRGDVVLIGCAFIGRANQFCRPMAGCGQRRWGSNNATFAVSGTIGQPVTAVSGSNNITLSSGYWSGLSANYDIYLPAIIKQ